jgi:hypothetical protein
LTSDAVNCISHAHSDHLPRGFESERAIASRITLRCASEGGCRGFLAHVQMLERGI